LLKDNDYSFGITSIDTGYVRDGFDASHLIIEQNKAAFVDVGTSLSVKALLNALKQKNIPRDNVEYVMVTHIHLDHAGGAGELIKHLDNAKLVVHPRGSRHMINPEKLIASATSVYGLKEMEASFGEIIPVPEERVIETHDGFNLSLNGRNFLFIDTPGHAKHHYSIFDEKSSNIFSGDTFGLSYREFDTDKGYFIFPSTSPVQFNPDDLHTSIDRLISLKPEYIFLTHYSRVNDLSRLADDLHIFIEKFTDLAKNLKNIEKNRLELLEKGIGEIIISSLIDHGCSLSYKQIHSMLDMDIRLNAQGINHWINLQKK